MAKKSTIKVSHANDYIVDWLKDYALNSKMDGFVVGISGGIDSAVTSTLCAQTGLKTLCLEMPIHQAQSHVNRAQEHISHLKQKFPNVDSDVANLTTVFETFKKEVPNQGDESAVNLALANTRARLRMTTLYYFAGLENLLVVGTGNKVEDFGVGFYTKYGDGGVDISPIGDLMKSDVFALGAFQQVPESILVARPTDGLFGDDRSDEDQIGATYDELEWAMKVVAEGKTGNDFSGREKDVVAIYVKRNANNRHKMVAIPVCSIPDSFWQ